MNNHAILTDFEIFQGLVALMFNATLKISYITSVTLCLEKTYTTNHIPSLLYILKIVSSTHHK